MAESQTPQVSMPVRRYFESIPVAGRPESVPPVDRKYNFLVSTSRAATRVRCGVQRNVSYFSGQSGLLSRAHSELLRQLDLIADDALALAPFLRQRRAR